MYDLRITLYSLISEMSHSCIKMQIKVWKNIFYLNFYRFCSTKDKKFLDHSINLNLRLEGAWKCTCIGKTICFFFTVSIDKTLMNTQLLLNDKSTPSILHKW